METVRGPTLCIHGHPVESKPCLECKAEIEAREAARAADPKGYDAEQAVLFRRWINKEARRRGW